MPGAHVGSCARFFGGGTAATGRGFCEPLAEQKVDSTGRLSGMEETLAQLEEVRKAYNLLQDQASKRGKGPLQEMREPEAEKQRSRRS